MAKVSSEPIEPSFHPLEDHPEYVKAIGMISLEAIALELRLARLLARTLSIPVKTAQAIYLTPKAEQTRIDIFRNTAHAALSVAPGKKNSVLGRQKTKALNAIMGIINRAETLIRERHRVIHDEWNYSDTEKKITRRLVDGRYGRERVPVPIGDLKNLIRRMRVLIDDAYDLSEAFREHPPTMVDLSNTPRTFEDALKTSSKRSAIKSA